MSSDLADGAPPRRSSVVRDLGAAGIDLFVGARALYGVFVQTLYYVARGRRERGATVRQMHAIGNQSLFFVSITMGFIGMILVYQSGLQIKRVIPDFSLLGATYLQLLVRDLAASLGGLMLATRVGAGIAAEIGVAGARLMRSSLSSSSIPSSPDARSASMS